MSEPADERREEEGVLPSPGEEKEIEKTTLFRVVAPFSYPLGDLGTGPVQLAPDLRIDQYDRASFFEEIKQQYGQFGIISFAPQRRALIYETQVVAGTHLKDAQRDAELLLADVMTSFWLSGVRFTTNDWLFTFYSIADSKEFADLKFWLPFTRPNRDSGVEITAQVVETAKLLLAAMRAFAPKNSTVRTALAFLLIALRNGEIGPRLVHLWIALEGLFGVEKGTSEVTYRTCQRIALFLSTDPDERLAKYKVSKDSYGWRSKVVHGSRVEKEKPGEAVDCLLQTEALLSGALVRMLSDPALLAKFNGKERDRFLERLAFE